VIFKSQNHTTFFRGGHNLLQAINNPLETVLIGVAFQGRLDAPVLHQVIKVPAGSPAAGIDPHGGDAQLVGQFNLMNCQVNVFLSFLCVRIYKTLVGGKSHQIESAMKSSLFQAVEVRYFLRGQLYQ